MAPEAPFLDLRDAHGFLQVSSREPEADFNSAECKIALSQLRLFAHEIDELSKATTIVVHHRTKRKISTGRLQRVARRYRSLRSTMSHGPVTQPSRDKFNKWLTSASDL